MTGGPFDRTWISLPIHALDVTPQALDFGLHYGKVLRIGMDCGSHIADILANVLKYRMQVRHDAQNRDYSDRDQPNVASGDERHAFLSGSIRFAGW